MSARAVIFDIIGRDSASPVLLRVAGAADKAGGAVSRMNAVAARTGAIGASLGKHITLPLLAVAGASVDVAAKFQKSMTLLQTAAGESAKNMGVVSSGIKDIAKTTGTNLEQLAEGMYTVEKAGVRGANGLLVLKAAAEGAKAENVDLATATNALTSVMMSYHLSADKAVSTENMLIRGSGLAKTTMQEYAASLATVVPIASAAGISFDQVAGAIATLTQHGTSAHEATQELAFTIRNLLRPNAVAAKAMGQLGISVTDLEKGLGKRGLSGTLDLIEGKLGASSKAGMVVVSAFKSSQQATANLNTEIAAMPPGLAKMSKEFLNNKITFKDYSSGIKGLGASQHQMGKDFLSSVSQAKGFNSLLSSGQPAVRTYAAALRDVLGGATGLNTALQLGGENTKYFHKAIDEVAVGARKAGTDVLGWSKTQGTLTVKLDKAKANLQVLAVEIGTALIPAVAKVVGWVTKAVQWFEGLSSGWKHAIGYAALFVGALGPVLSIFSRLSRLVGGLIGLGARVVAFGRTMSGAFTGSAAASTTAALQIEADNLLVQASELDAAAVTLRAEATKARAAATTAEAVAVSAEEQNSILAAGARATAVSAAAFATSMEEEATAAELAAAQVKASAIEASTAVERQAAVTRTAVGGMATSARRSAGLFSAALIGAGSGSIIGSMTETSSTAVKIGGVIAAAGVGAAIGWSMGGPWGAAVGGVIGGVSDLVTAFGHGGDAADSASKAAQAALAAERQAAESLLEALRAVNGQYGKNYRASIAALLQKSGAFDQVTLGGTRNTHHQGYLDPKLATDYALGKIDMSRIYKALGLKAGDTLLADQKKIIASLKQARQAAGGAEVAYQAFQRAMNTTVVPAKLLKLGVAGLAKEFKGQARDLYDVVNATDEQTAATGRNNAIVKLNIQQFKNSAISAVAHGQSIKTVTAAYYGNLLALQNQLTALGFNKKEVADVISLYGAIPKLKNVKIETNAQQISDKIGNITDRINNIRQGHVPGLKVHSAEADAEIARLQRMLDSLRNKEITLTVNAVGRGLGLVGAGFGFASGGGAIFGGGSETSDSIPARLSNNEHVWTAKEVRGAGGHGAVHAMRQAARAGRRVPGFAAGGPVGFADGGAATYDVWGKSYTGRKSADAALAADIRLLNKTMRHLGTADIGSLTASLNKTGGDVLTAWGNAKADLKTMHIPTNIIKDMSRLAGQLAHDVNMRNKYREERATVRTAVTGAFDVATAGTGGGSDKRPTFGRILAQGRQELTIIHRWAAGLRKLGRTFGKSSTGKNMLRQLAEAGPASWPQVQALESAGPGLLRELVGVERSIGQAGQSVGGYVGGKLYGGSHDRAIAAEMAELRRDLRHYAERPINVTIKLNGRDIAQATATGTAQQGRRK